MRHTMQRLLVVTLILSGLVALSARAAEEINTIHIATPAWANQTHANGTGIFFEIVKAVYEPAGIKMEWTITTWNRAERMIKSGKADARLAVARTSEDQLMPRYPLYVDYTAVVFTKGALDWQGLQSLDGKRAVWPRGYDFHLQKPFQGIELEWSDIRSPNQAWEMLERGDTDVYIDALIDVTPYIEHHGIDMDAYQLEVPYGQNCFLEFGTDTERSRKLMEIYDSRVPELLESGELQKIFDKWGVKFESFEPRTE